LKHIVTERETGGNIIWSIGNMVRGANKLIHEIPRMRAYSSASNAVRRNVEKHRREHFMRLIDMGLDEKDPEKGSKLIETVKDITEAYKLHRDSFLQKEIIEHVKHVGKKKSPEMLVALGEVAKHISRMGHANIDGKHAEIILKALTYARSPNTLKSPDEREYAKRMSILKEHLKKYREGEKEEAIRKIQEIMEEWGWRQA